MGNVVVAILTIFDLLKFLAGPIVVFSLIARITDIF